MRYRQHDPNLYEKPPKWVEEWIPPKEYELGRDSYSEGDEDLDGPQHDQNYLTWWARVISKACKRRSKRRRRRQGGGRR